MMSHGLDNGLGLDSLTLDSVLPHLGLGLGLDSVKVLKSHSPSVLVITLPHPRRGSWSQPLSKPHFLIRLYMLWSQS